MHKFFQVGFAVTANYDAVWRVGRGRRLGHLNPHLIGAAFRDITGLFQRVFLGRIPLDNLRQQTETGFGWTPFHNFAAFDIHPVQQLRAQAFVDKVRMDAPVHPRMHRLFRAVPNDRIASQRAAAEDADRGAADVIVRLLPFDPNVFGLELGIRADMRGDGSRGFGVFMGVIQGQRSGDKIGMDHRLLLCFRARRKVNLRINSQAVKADWRGLSKMKSLA